MFTKIFGSKKPLMVSKAFELISGANNTFTSYDGNIFQNDIVRSCLRPKANAIGKLNAKHVKGEGDNIKLNPSKKIKKILRRPNQYMSMQDFLMKMTLQREINHNAFAYVKRDSFTGEVQEIYPIPYSLVELLDVQGEVYCRFQFWTGKWMTVPYTDLIHLRKDFYSHDFFGDKGDQALKSIMEVIVITDQGVVAAIKNSAIVKWIMMFKNVLQPKDKEMAVEDFTKNYLAIEKASGVAVSDPRYDLKQVDEKNYVPNALQMDKAIQRLYSYFGVNDAIVQNKFTEDNWNAFYESEIEPVVIQLSNSFTEIFFTETQQENNKIIFEASNLAYASMNTKLSLVQMVDRGAMTPNQWRNVMNLGPIEGGEKPIRRLDTAEVKNVVGKDIKDQEGDDKKDDS